MYIQKELYFVVPLSASDPTLNHIYTEADYTGMAAGVNSHLSHQSGVMTKYFFEKKLNLFLVIQTIFIFDVQSFNISNNTKKMSLISRDSLCKIPLLTSLDFKDIGSWREIKIISSFHVFDNLTLFKNICLKHETRL